MVCHNSYFDTELLTEVMPVAFILPYSVPHLSVCLDAPQKDPHFDQTLSSTSYFIRLSDLSPVVYPTGRTSLLPDRTAPMVASAANWFAQFCASPDVVPSFWNPDPGVYCLARQERLLLPAGALLFARIAAVLSPRYIVTEFKSRSSRGEYDVTGTDVCMGFACQYLTVA